jgi:hypothetical protein
MTKKKDLARNAVFAAARKNRATLFVGIGTLLAFILVIICSQLISDRYLQSELEGLLDQIYTQGKSKNLAVHLLPDVGLGAPAIDVEEALALNPSVKIFSLVSRDREKVLQLLHHYKKIERRPNQIIRALINRIDPPPLIKIGSDQDPWRTFQNYHKNSESIQSEN